MTTRNEASEGTLIPEGFTLRAAQWADAERASELTHEYWSAIGDPALTISPDDMRRFWKSSHLRMETDIWVVETPESRIVGYEEFYNRHAHAFLVGEGYVHPEFQGRGIGTVLLRLLVRRAHEEAQLAEPGARVFLRNGVSAADAAGCRLHEAEGFKPVRYSWHMEIQLQAAPVPNWPAGIELRPLDLEAHDRLVFEAHERAFSEHFGHVPGTFGDWQHHMSGRDDFDPGLWHIAWDGEQIAGYALCNFFGGVGWLDKIGVLPEWRRRGLGMALLQQTFADFWRRGMRRVSLGTDAANRTGATRLYERAGMQVVSEIIRYEKELRPGRELAA